MVKGVISKSCGIKFCKLIISKNKSFCVLALCAVIIPAIDELLSKLFFCYNRIAENHLAAESFIRPLIPE